jgi:hypothetical protein
MGEPFEVMAGPFEVYLAPVGTAFPAIDATPGNDWELLGKSGAKSYTEDGVKVRSEQNIEKFRPLGTTGIRKVWRTSEDLMVEFTVADATLESYASVLNDATVTDTAAGIGTAGHRSIPLLQGYDVATYAMLIRGDGLSPYGDGWNTQWEIPIVHQQDNPETTYVKGVPVGLKCTFAATEDDTTGYGYLRTQDAEALTS